MQITAENQTSKVNIPLYVERKIPEWMTKEELGELPEERSILLSDYDESVLYLEMQANSCSKGHTLSLYVLLPTLDDRPEFRFICTVQGANPLPDNRIEVKAKLVSGQETDWKVFTEIFSSRQNEIDDFFKAAKGR